jgi:hypothetical protein
VFDRYNIVSEKDLHEAAERLSAHLDRQDKSLKVIPLASASDGRPAQYPHNSRSGENSLTDQKSTSHRKS